MMKKHIKMSEAIYRWGCGCILEFKIRQNGEMLSLVHPSPTTSTRSLGGITSVKMGQDYRLLWQHVAYFLDFWALFCLKPT